MLRSSMSYWYKPQINFIAMLLMPFAWLFGLVVAVRKWCYQKNIFKSYKAPVPVIVVGNLTVGGTGKTPCVIALSKFLKSHGYMPGIVSRGVGGSKHVQPYTVSRSSSAVTVGDEALLLVRETGCPMVVCLNRADAIKSLLVSHPECNIVLSDDGLQHYRMQRDVEIIVVDGERQFGNQMMLPAGPLREPMTRLKQTDFIVVNNGQMESAYQMSLQPQKWMSVKGSASCPLDFWDGKSVHAVAAIGNPGKFFRTVHEWCGGVVEHAFPDHYQYQAKDLRYADDRPVLMTGKDAVKYEQFADERHWYLDVVVNLDEKLLQGILSKIN